MNEEERSRRNGDQMAGDKSGEQSIVSSIMEEDDNDSNSNSSANITNDDDITYTTHTIHEDEDGDSQTQRPARHMNHDVDGDDDDDDDDNDDEEEEETQNEEDNDDDLSETVYDENDQSTTNRSQYGGTSLGPFSEDEEIDEDDSLLFEDSTSINHIRPNQIRGRRRERDNHSPSHNHNHRHAHNHTIHHRHGARMDENNDNQIQNQSNLDIHNGDHDDAHTNDNNSNASGSDNEIMDDNHHNDDDDDDDDDNDDDNNSNNEEEDDHHHDHDDGDDDATNPNNTSDNSGDPNPYLEEADQVLQDLLLQYDTIPPPAQSQLNNQNNNTPNNHNSTTNRHPQQLIPIDEYKDALEQLSSKWEQIHEQITYEHEQQIDTVVTERNELEIAIDEIQRRHRGEIDSTKQQVMEQSQRIIMEEMKANADREIKSEETIDLAVKQAVEETKQTMNQEFEIALNGMKEAQEELTLRYEKLIEETKVRVKHEVQSQAKKEADVKIHSFLESYNEVKQQVVDLTLELEKKEFELATNHNQHIHEDAIQEKNDQIEELTHSLQHKTKQLEDLRTAHEQDVKTLEESVKHDKQLLIQKITVFEESQKREYEDRLAKEVQKATQSTKTKMNSDYQIIISGMKSSQQRVQNECEKRVKNTEMRVREEMETIANDNAQREIADFMEDYQRLKTQLTKMTKEMDQLKANPSIIPLDHQELEESKNKICSLNNKLTTQHNETKNLMDKLQTLEQMTTIDNDYQAQIHTMKDAYENQIVTLQQSLQEKEYELSQRDTELQKSIEAATETLSERLMRQNSDEVELLERAQLRTNHDIQTLHEQEIKKLQEKYEVERCEVLDLNQKLQVKIDTLNESQMCISNDGKGENDESNETLIQLHEEEVNQLKKTHLDDISELRSLLESLRNKKDELELAHQSNTENGNKTLRMMKEEYRLVQMELQKVKNENEILNKRNTSTVGAGAGASASVGERGIIETLNVEGLSISLTTNSQDDENKNIGSGGQNKIVSPEFETVLSPKSCGEEDKENSTASRDGDSLTSALNATSTPPRKNVEQTFQDLSPLTLGSPSPQSNTGMTKKTIATPSRTKIGGSTGANTAKAKANGITPPRAKRSTDKARRGSTSTRGSARESRIPTPKTHSVRSNNKTSRVGSSSGSIKKTISQSGLRKTSNHSDRTLRSGNAAKMPSPTSSTSTNLRLVDKTPSRMPKRSDLVGSSARRDAGSEKKVHLMVVNVPITDKVKKMAKILKIEITDDPFEATHVIAGDSQHHLRRTAKLMTVLCLTSNIIKAEWLEDCFKKKSILSCSHYLLHDPKAEKSYSFSMKQTLMEGKERRTDGGLLAGWKILFCDKVAGNKAPKEADLRMMVEAAGGSWLLSSDVPVPISEDPTHVIVITSDPALPSQAEEEKASIAAENGAGFFTTTWLFDCMMHQKLFGLRRGIGRL